MSPLLGTDWAALTRDLLERYSEPLLRNVVQRLLKPRVTLPAGELVQRVLEMFDNPIAIDRRVKELSGATRRVLTLIGLSRRPCWRIGTLTACLATLGCSEGIGPLMSLLELGLLYPMVGEQPGPIREFEACLGSAVLDAQVFAPPAVTNRCLLDPLPLPTFSTTSASGVIPCETDGLELPLRMTVVWQQLAEAPLRKTMQEQLFKRDLTRLQTDPLLTAPLVVQPGAIPAIGVLSLFLAEQLGMLETREGELHAVPTLPSCFDQNLTALLKGIWSMLPGLRSWDPLQGAAPESPWPDQLPSLLFLAFLALGAVPKGEWVAPREIACWLRACHPSWRGSPEAATDADAERWLSALYLGLGVQLRLVEAAQTLTGWLVRAAPLARHLLNGEAEPVLQQEFRQTLLVQPNSEILVYRQGLSIPLLGRLARFARWKTIGAACTLELEPKRVYLGLESGLSLPDVTRTLQQHGMRPIPPAVAEQLQSWANKRERITIYPSATLLEFATPADLDEAVSRGLIAVRLTERVGLVPQEGAVDFKHFRLIGNRDYEARPQRCISFAEDGVTFTVDMAQSDLLLEADLGRMAELLGEDGATKRRYRLTPKSLRHALLTGLTVNELDQWFTERSGFNLSPAARLLMTGGSVGKVRGERHIVVTVPNETIGAGLQQWPPTAECIVAKLGPTAFAVAENRLGEFRVRLSELGIELCFDGT